MTIKEEKSMINGKPINFPLKFHSHTQTNNRNKALDGGSLMNIPK